MSGVALPYRPDIDGLRAVAITSVLFFHAFPGYLPGGFVGVDVFFVISGFLISGIILKDLDRGRFSFADFYAPVARIFVTARPRYKLFQLRDSAMRKSPGYGEVH
jgi:peptidoglycan/LPS O-acetylase OafA/YrhL